jgi:hypothetical protein
VASLPAFDATLLLSVHHHWLRAYGPDRTRDMLRALAERTEQVLVFQAPSRRVRYGEHAPDFIDNDEQSVTTFITGYLATTIADQFSRIEPLGPAPCVGDREPYRWSFGLYK